MGGGHRGGPRIGGPSYIVTLFAAVASSLGSAAARAQTPAEQAPPEPPPVLPVVVAPPSPTAAPRPGEVPEGVFVELRADAPGVRIDRYVGDDSARIAVCSAPCRRVLPRDGRYVIDGVGIRTTSRFSLPEDQRQLILDVKAGSAAQNVGGAFLIVGRGRHNLPRSHLRGAARARCSRRAQQLPDRGWDARGAAHRRGPRRGAGRDSEPDLENHGDHQLRGDLHPRARHAPAERPDCGDAPRPRVLARRRFHRGDAVEMPLGGCFRVPRASGRKTC